MKQLNKSLVINIIRDHRQISRVDIARETGLNRSTVTNLVRELMDENVVIKSISVCKIPRLDELSVLG